MNTYNLILAYFLCFMRTGMTDWRTETKLTKLEEDVIWYKGTERPFTGEYDAFFPKQGYFACKVCNNPIYSWSSKFQSGCGWPAFDKCYEGSIKTIEDNSLQRRRVEIVCAQCNGHLGHVFHGEFKTDTNERHCVNSVSVKYVDGEPPATREQPLGMDEETQQKMESIKQILAMREQMKQQK